MAKKTKRIPHDEMLLAEAIAAAEANKLKGCSGIPFSTTYDFGTKKHTAVACCAVGALAVVKKGDVQKAMDADAYKAARTLLNNEGLRRWDTTAVFNGNDVASTWSPDRGDGGESFGWAFRNAMDPTFGA